MPRTTRTTPAPSPRPTEQAALAVQKSDFTAEGSPPPGQVANTAPVLAQLATRPDATAAPVPLPGPTPRRALPAPRRSRARYP